MSEKIINNSGDHTNFTMIPNVIFEMGLTSHEISLYILYKKVCGEKGECFMGGRKICKILKITDKTHKKSKENLKKKGLISIEKHSKKEGGQHIIQILNIWNINKNHYSKKDYVSENDDRGVGKERQGVSENDGTNKNPIKEEPIKEELVPHENRVVGHFLKRYNAYKKTINVEVLEEKDLTNNWFIEANRLLKKYPEEKIIEVIDYIFEDKFWKKTVKSPGGLRKNFNTLIEKIAESKTSSAVVNESVEYKKLKLIHDRYKAWYDKLNDTYLIDRGFLRLETNCFYDNKNPLFKYKLNYDKFMELLRNKYRVPERILK